MALNVQIGLIDPNPLTAGSTEVINLPAGFDLKAIQFETVGRQALGNPGRGDLLWSSGAATKRGGTIQSWYALGGDDNAAGTSLTYRGVNNTNGTVIKCLGGTTFDTTVTLDARVTDFQAEQFTLTLGAVSGTNRPQIMYIAFGGSDITDAIAGTASAPAATGANNHSIAAGFGNPDLLYVVTGGRDILGDEATHGQIAEGWAVSPSEQYVAAYGFPDAQTSMALAQYHKSGSLICALTSTGVVETEGSLVAPTVTDTFRINYTTATGVNTFGYLAFRLSASVERKIAVATARTTVGDQDHSLASGTAKLGLVWGTQMGATTNVVTGAVAGVASVNDFGFQTGATDGTTEICLGGSNQDGNTASISSVSVDTVKSLRHFDGSATPVVKTEADGVLTGPTFRLSFTTVDTTIARQYGVLVLGEAAAAGPSAAVSTSTRLSGTVAGAKATGGAASATHRAGHAVTAQKGASGAAQASHLVTHAVAGRKGAAAAVAIAHRLGHTVSGTALIIQQAFGSSHIGMRLTALATGTKQGAGQVAHPTRAVHTATGRKNGAGAVSSPIGHRHQASGTKAASGAPSHPTAVRTTVAGRKAASGLSAISHRLAHTVAGTALELIQKFGASSIGMRLAHAATGIKGGQGQPAVTARVRHTVTTGPKNVTGTVTTTIRPRGTVTGRKAATGLAVTSSTLRVSVAGAKGASGISQLSLRVQHTGASFRGGAVGPPGDPGWIERPGVAGSIDGADSGSVRAATGGKVT